MLRGRTLEVDYSDAARRLSGREIVEECIGLGYLDTCAEDCGIQRGSGQARVVRFAQRDMAFVPAFKRFRSPGELDEVIPRDVVGDDGPRGGRGGARDELCGSHCRRHVADRHARLQCKKTGDLAASFSESRCSSAERLGLTIDATAPSEGNSFAGTPGGAR